MKNFYLNVTLSEEWRNSILWYDKVRGTFGCLLFNYNPPRYVTNDYLAESQVKDHRKKLIIKRIL